MGGLAGATSIPLERGFENEAAASIPLERGFENQALGPQGSRASGLQGLRAPGSGLEVSSEAGKL